jgi:predicted transcriptional regulator
MAAADEVVRLSLALSPDLYARLEKLASDNHTTKSEVLRRAVALFDVVSEAKAQKKRFGILNKDKELETEIVGL